MDLYITFGCAHKHEVNGVKIDGSRHCVLLKDVESRSKGRELAFYLFGPKFCTDYTERPDRYEVIEINVTVLKGLS